MHSGGSRFLFLIYPIYNGYNARLQLMSSSALVCSLAGLCKSYTIDFHRIRWRGGTWATEETMRFRWQPGSRNFRVGLWLRLGGGILRVEGYVTGRLFNSNNILRHQRPWRKYELYCHYSFTSGIVN